MSDDTSPRALFEHAVPGLVQSHPRISVAMHVLGMMLETELGGSDSVEYQHRNRGLTSDEAQLKKASVTLLTQYLNGEAILDSLQLFPNVAEANMHAMHQAPEDEEEEEEDDRLEFIQVPRDAVKDVIFNGRPCRAFSMNGRTFLIPGRAKE